jgi:hypothetical protein
MRACCSAGSTGRPAGTGTGGVRGGACWARIGVRSKNARIPSRPYGCIRLKRIDLGPGRLQVVNPGCGIMRALGCRRRVSMIQRTEARRLSSINEWSLISSSLPPALGTLSVARLKSKIARAGELRQKYQDLYRRQKISSTRRMTGAPKEKLNVRTARKRQMFDEAIVRLKVELRKVSAPQKTAPVPVRKPTKKGTSIPASRSTQLESARRRQSLSSRETSPALRKAAKLHAAGYARRHSHALAAAGRRQSKRDSINRSR